MTETAERQKLKQALETLDAAQKQLEIKQNARAGCQARWSATWDEIERLKEKASSAPSRAEVMVAEASGEPIRIDHHRESVEDDLLEARSQLKELKETEKELEELVKRAESTVALHKMTVDEAANRVLCTELDFEHLKARYAEVRATFAEMSDLIDSARSRAIQLGLKLNLPATDRPSFLERRPGWFNMDAEKQRLIADPDCTLNFTF